MTIKDFFRGMFCLPMYLGTLLALVIHALWGRRSWWQNGVFLTELNPESWLQKGWFKPWGGLTLGYGIVLAPDMAESVLKHEMVHVEQLEGASIGGILTGIIMAAICHSVWGVLAFGVCWLTAPWLAYAGASLAAFFRGEADSYRGNHLEEAARSIGQS
jgi:hypothetical protein